MPAWGLTRDQIDSEPWGLSPGLLLPRKKITDPVHGEIYLTRLEVAVLDSRPLQRLRRVRQLGATHLVYPGATHSRFSHALGTQRVAQDLLDVAIDQRLTPSPVLDLFQEWETELDPDENAHRTAEVVVLARLGALLHDLGHIPFGHTLEDDLGILEAHDANEPRFDFLWAQLSEDLISLTDLQQGGVVLSEHLIEQLKLLILSKSKSDSDVEHKYPFVDDIVGNTICADLLDYLKRDHYYTGLPSSLGNRFLDGFYVTRSDHPHHPQRMVIRIRRRGQRRADVVSELFKYLRYRYELSERALVHHAKLSADVMLGKVFEMWRAALETLDGGDTAATEIMERELLRRGDDGIVEHLIDEAEQRPDDKRWRAIEQLATKIQGRRLFKPAGTCSNRAMAEYLYTTFGSQVARQQVEEDAADYAGLERSWMVAIWVPDPQMRFKPADVYADDGDGVATLRALDEEHHLGGEDIFQRHRDLWTARAYIDPQVDEERRPVVLAKLATSLGIKWAEQKEDLSELAVDRVAQQRTVSREQRSELLELARREVAGRPTFDDLVAVLASEVERESGSALAAWRAMPESSLEHPDLGSRIESRRESTVTLDRKRFDVSQTLEVARLNLRLFLRELPEELFGDVGGRSAVSDLFNESTSEVYGYALGQLSTSAAARRGGADEDASSGALLAIELAVRDLLSTPPEPTLFPDEQS